MASEVKEIIFPFAGVDQRLAFAHQPPFTTPDALNVWPRDTLSGRMRGGSRPGLVKAFPTGVTGPVHLLANVRVIETPADADTTFEDQFLNPSISQAWTYPSWRPDRQLVIDPQAPGTLSLVGGPTVLEGAMVLKSLGMTVSQSYKATISILPSLWYSAQGTFIGATTTASSYHLFARMDDANPNINQEGIRVQWKPSPGSLTLSSNIAGVQTSVVSATTGVWTLASSVEITLTVDSDDTCTVTMAGVELQQTVSATIVNAAFGQRFGIGMVSPALASTSGTQYHRVDYFRAVFKGDAPSDNRNQIVVIGGSSTNPVRVDIKFENTPNTLVAPATPAISNPKGRQLVGAELLGKLYIIGEDDEPLWQFDGSGAGALTTVAGAPDDGFTMTVWRGRVCVVERDDQQNIVMSKAGSSPPTWVEGSIPIGSSMKLNTTGIDTGKLGEPINALIAHSDDNLIPGLLNSLFVLRGDPTLSGQMDRLSASIGVIAPQAWARGPDGETVILSSDGLYGLPPGALAYPDSISRERLPNELRDIDVTNYRILMAYDVRNRGVFIGLTPMLAGGGTYFWFDWETRGFWPMSFNEAHEPTALVFRNADSPLDQRLLLGCRDGFIRTFDNNASTDDGVNFASFVLIGPIMLGGGGYYDGMLREIVGQLGLGSGNVTCEVQVGNSIEAARRATPRAAFTLRAGKNLTNRPVLRGNTAFIRLSSPGGSRWAMENLSIVRERLGKQRL